MRIQLALLFALCCFSTTTLASPSAEGELPRVTVPLFKQPTAELSSELMFANMHEGCTVIAQGDTSKLTECGKLVDSLSIWTRVVKGELVYFGLMYQQLTNEDRLLHHETLEKNFERLRQARQQLDKRYPFVRFYNTGIQWDV